jgi:hypothetical protein
MDSMNATGIGWKKAGMSERLFERRPGLYLPLHRPLLHTVSHCFKGGRNSHTIDIVDVIRPCSGVS